MSTPTTPRRSESDVPRADEGYFGPESVSWRLFSDPSSKLGGAVAILMQALNPMMMRLFDSVSGYANDTEGRAERTGRYIDTITFGDRAHADAAAASVRRLHAHAQWVDPHTGMELRADNPEWLLWTHNTVVWGVLRAAEAFGPDLTASERDTFVREQHQAARLVGIDPEHIAADWQSLNDYIHEQKNWMALTLPAAEVTRSLRKPSLGGNPLRSWVAVIVQDGVIHLLPDWAQLLYGIEGRPMSPRRAAATTGRILRRARCKTSTEELVNEVTQRVTTHPYRKVRAR